MLKGLYLMINNWFFKFYEQGFARATELASSMNILLSYADLLAHLTFPPLLANTNHGKNSR